MCVGVVKEKTSSPPVCERLGAAHGVGDDGGVLDRGVGELLPGGGQQDLLGTAGPGLLQDDKDQIKKHENMLIYKQTAANRYKTSVAGERTKPKLGLINIFAILP